MSPALRRGERERKRERERERKSEKEKERYQVERLTLVNSGRNS